MTTDSLAHRIGLPVFAVVIVSFFSQLPSGKLAAIESAQAKTAFSWKFQRSQDKNADRQPDGWRRRRDREHPSFIQAQITARDPQAFREAKETEANLAKVYNAWKTGIWSPKYVPEVTPPELATLMDASLLNECYEVRMDGGTFECVSPRFDIDNRYDYILEAELECQKLDQHQATVELRLIDSQGNLIAAYSTRPATGSQSWKFSRTSNFSIPEQGKVRGEICIRVQPISSTFGRGIARFDNIRLQRMPTLIIKSNTPHNITSTHSIVDFSCIANGLLDLQENIQLTITDIDGQTIYQRSLPLMKSTASEESTGNFVSLSKSGLTSPTAVGKSMAVFPVLFEQSGVFYVQARLGNAKRQILMVVMDSVRPQKGPFGLSLQNVPPSEEVPMLLQIMELSQASWVKLPIWYDSEDADKAKATLALVKGLKQLGITTIGRLDGPPTSQYKYFQEDPSLTQSIFHLQEPKIWEPLLDPVLSEINNYINHLQLGTDTDFGFIVGPGAVETLEKVRSVLQYYFQDPKLAIACDWLTPLTSGAENESANSPIQYIHYSTRPQLTAAEITNYASSHNDQRLKLWTSIDPLPEPIYSLQDRVVDLLQKMISIKQSNIEAAFVTPFEEESGILDQNFLPKEILIPWIRVAAAIGPRTLVGAIDMPQGSRNLTFQGLNGDVMILWNSRDVVEQIFFGDDIKASDIWGRPIQVQQVVTDNGGTVQQIAVGKWPIFIDGVDSNVVRWRQEFKLLTDHLNSHLSSENILPLQVLNTLPKRAKGTLVLSCPSLLRNGQQQTILDIEVGNSVQIDMPIEFRSDASAGTHQLEIQFQLKADKDYFFTIQRDLKLGHPAIEFRWELIRMTDDTVEARVELDNMTTEPVDFDCCLFPPNHPYIRFDLTNCTPGTTTRIYRLRIPQSLDGQRAPIWIRCEQIRSPLTLNYLVQETQSSLP